MEELPREFFQVRRISLRKATQPLDDLLITLSQLRFAEFDRLEALDLTGTGLREFAGLEPVHGLQELTLAKMGLTDDDLARLPKLTQLRRLVLDGTPIRGPGLAKLAEWPALTDLSLAGSGLTDDGVKHLFGLSSLKVLDLTGTSVTVAGVAALQKALPECRITSNPQEK